MPSSTSRVRFRSSRLARTPLLVATLLTSPVVGLAPALVGCSDETVDDGSIRGTLAVYIATMDDGTSRTDYQILIDGNESAARALVFGAAPDVTSGSEIKVWGVFEGESILVDRFEVVSDASGLGKSTEAIIDGTPYASRSMGYFLVDIGGGNGSYTDAAARIDLVGTGASDGSVKQWFLEASYGRQDISGNAVGGLSFAMSGCNYSALASGLRTAANTALGMTPQHYLWYFRTDNSSCGWAGLAGLGSPQSPSRDTWYNNSSSCVVLVQEPAHNFGMQHSSALDCGGASFASNPSSCTHSEYGNRHDPMGGGCRHTNAWQKASQGWFGGCNSVRVNQSGTYTLHPLEVECNGIQVLQIPMPVTNRVIPRSGGGGNPSNDPVQFYYLELRTRTGFDQPQTTYPTVLVNVGPDYRSRTQTGMHTWILDMVPSSEGANSYDGMGAGASFSDPAGGVSFSVTSLSATSASIAVTVPTNSANTCSGGGNLTAPGPTTCGGPTGGTGGMGGMAGTGGMGGRGGAGAGGTAGSAGRGGAGAGGAGPGGTGAGGMPGGSGGAGTGPGGASGDGGMSGAGGMSGDGGINGGGLGGDSSAGAGGLAGAGGISVAGAGGIVAPGGAGPGVAGAAPGAGAGGIAAGAGVGPTAGSGPRIPPNLENDDDDSEADASCGCRLDKAPPRHEAALWLGVLGLVAAGMARRRRTNRT